jgi:asparagine synthetase B (glutamine-hydrolysing)
VARNPGDGEDPDSDVHHARRVAEALEIPLEVIEIAPDALPERLDEVLLYGQDFRDFNVHCGLVNAVLASAISKLERAHGTSRPCVLTGDTMNELMADYTPVQYGSSEYYSLPNLSRGKLRRFLVSGLDSGDREVGIFAHHGIDVVQPYALCPSAYTALPAAFLDDEDAKQRLARLVMGDRIPPFIYTRRKVRAQVAGSEKVGGTMAALLDRGIDGAALAARFCELFGFEASELKRWMRAGVYRFTSSFPEVA